MRIRRLVALLVPILLLLTFPACTKDISTENPSETGETILTNVYKGKRIPVPDGYTVCASVQPYYDDTAESLTLLCSRETDVDRYENLLLTITPDGTVTNERPLKIDGAPAVGRGVLTVDKLYFLRTVYDLARNTQTSHVAIFSLTDGTLTVSDDVTGLFSIGSPSISSNFSVTDLLLDGTGNLFLVGEIIGEGETVVLNASLEKQCTLPAPLYGTRCSPDGTVYFLTDEGVCPVDPTARSVGDPIPLERPSDVTNWSYRDIWFGHGYDLFYATEKGFYGYNFTAETPEPVLLIDAANADLLTNNLNVAYIFDPDHILMYERDDSGRFPILYTRSADIDLTKIQTIEIACVSADRDLSLRIAEFNKTNDSVRVIMTDYNVYNTDENPDGGEQKLLNDLLLGLYAPDIVTGSSTDNVLKQLYENDLCTDLYPFMETGSIRKDDLLGCIKRTFATENGGLWAIGPLFCVDTVYGPTALLGERTGWTLSELLDFANALPEDTSLIRYFCQSSVTNLMLEKNGFGQFIDPKTNTCDFENEAFLGYLAFIAPLPATPAEANTALSMSTGIDPNDSAQISSLYHKGNIALQSGTIRGHESWLRMEAQFNTNDLTLIGYPTVDGTTSGSLVSMYAYVIPTFSDSPEEAWVFLETVMRSNDEDRYYRDFPALKSDLENVFEEMYQTLYTITFDGGMSTGRYTEEASNEPMDEPGFRKRFTEEDAAELWNWLDNDVGAPIANAADPEITAIINEEISAYLAGARAAADCANIIQSRVTLWLSEHE